MTAVRRCPCMVAAVLCAVLTACGGAAAGAQRQVASADTVHALRVQFLDVGQGDAALVTTPEGKHILVDAGPDDRQVADLLRQWHIDTIDLAVASHNHADHIGGMAAVFQGVVVRAYVENGMPNTTATYQTLLRAVEQEPGVQVLRATARTVTIGSVQCRVLPPSHVDESQNNNSVGLLVTFGRAHLLFTGDAEVQELGAWQRSGVLQPVTVLKVAHHGSRNGSSPSFARAVTPHTVVVSVGAGNRYRHPAPAVEQLWRATGARVLRTDQEGAIDIVALDDGRTTITTHAGTTRRAP